jgi:ABC-type transport system involved in multi-copper enzyme maturation permease subunit
MTAFAATTRYELRMQLRKPAIWIATAIPFGLFALLAMMGTQRGGLERLTQDTAPKTWMVESLGWFVTPLAMVFGIVLADRLVRDRKLGVAALLDVTPASRGARLAGKYLGACAATAVPPALIYLLVAMGFAVWRGEPVALFWGAATFAVVVLPLLLLAGALAFLGPQLMPTPLFRVLVVGIWFWAGATEVDSQFPSLAATVLSLTMDYPQHVFFGSTDASTGPFEGAALNFLRPHPTAATALLSLALILGLAAAIVVAARALNARTSD